MQEEVQKALRSKLSCPGHEAPPKSELSVVNVVVVVVVIKRNSNSYYYLGPRSCTHVHNLQPIIKLGGSKVVVGYVLGDGVQHQGKVEVACSPPLVVIDSPK